MKHSINSNVSNLRQRAEELLKRKIASTHDQLTEIEAIRLIHELEVQEIELELQQEELIWADDQATKIAALQYADLYDLAPVGYFTLSRNAEIIKLNISGSQMLGKARDQLHNSQFGFFVTEDTRMVFSHFIDKIFDTRESEVCEVKFLTNDHVAKHIQLAGVVSWNSDHCLITAADISCLKQAEAAMLESQKNLQKINAEKDKFFSIVAHDLRNSFNGFLGLSEVMVAELPDMSMKEIQQIALIMRDSAVNLYSMLGNLLEWARLQRGLITFSPELFLLLPDLSENLALPLEAAAKKDVSVRCDVPENLSVFADKYMFDVIIRNLMINAIKFTRRGGCILLSAQLNSDNDVQISIKDTGIGMSRQMIGDLFRLDKNTSRKGTDGEASTGLGLIICKDFVEIHSGKLWVESETDQGSEFYFSLSHAQNQMSKVISDKTQNN